MKTKLMSCLFCVGVGLVPSMASSMNEEVQFLYLQPIITQYFIDNKSEIWLLFLIAHSKR